MNIEWYGLPILQCSEFSKTVFFSNEATLNCHNPSNTLFLHGGNAGGYCIISQESSKEANKKKRQRADLKDEGLKEKAQ